jgi:MFS family permease
LVGFAGLFACVMALPFTSGFWIPALLGVVLSGCAAAAFSACAIVLADLGGPSGRGGAMGIYSLTVYLGQATGPAIVGVLIQRSGFQVGFIAAAAAGITLLVAGFVAVAAFRGAWRLDQARPVP